MRTYSIWRIAYFRSPEVPWHDCEGGLVNQKARWRSLGMVEAVGVAQRHATLTEGGKSIRDQCQHEYRKD